MLERARVQRLVCAACEVGAHSCCMAHHRWASEAEGTDRRMREILVWCDCSCLPLGFPQATP